MSAADSRDKRITRTLEARGAIDLEGRDWASLQPFPGSRPPYEIPSFYPDARKQPIVFRENGGQTSSARISLPAGWRLAAEVDWSRRNPFGSISFSAQEKDGVIEVRRDIVLAESRHEPEAVTDMKAFFRWMDEALKRTIAIRKESR